MTDHTAEPVPSLPDRRLRGCVERWPEAETGAYDPRCCRFPKSCSATVYDEGTVAEEDLEPAEPVSSTPAEPRVVVCQYSPNPHELNDDCVNVRPAEPLAQGGIAQPLIEADGGYLAPPDVLSVAADAADDAICRRLDHNQVIALVADAVWRIAHERGHAEGLARADAAVQRPCRAAFERGREHGKAEGIAERPDREAAKALIHPALHQLDVRINNLRGDCHCNLVAEVVLDALYGLSTEVVIDGSAAPTGGGQDGQ